MKKKFESAEVRVIQFEATDMISTSIGDNKAKLEALEEKLKIKFIYDGLKIQNMDYSQAQKDIDKAYSHVGSGQSAQNQLGSLVTCCQ